MVDWVMEHAKNRTDAEFELIDLAAFPLPHLDGPPEYNHSTSGVLKNAIDYLYAERNNKTMRVVSYGAVGGARAAEHLRLIAGELQMADVRTNVALSMMDQVIAGSTALAPLRAVRQAA